MTTFAQVRDSRVLSHFSKDITLAEAKAAFRDIAHELYVAPDNVSDGWTFNGSVFAPYLPSADDLRQEAIDAAILADSRIAQLKAMTNAQLASWWTGMTNAQRNDALFLLVKVIIRRVL